MTQNEGKISLFSQCSRVWIIIREFEQQFASPKLPNNYSHRLYCPNLAIFGSVAFIMSVVTEAILFKVQ